MPILQMIRSEQDFLVRSLKEKISRMIKMLPLKYLDKITFSQKVIDLHSVNTPISKKLLKNEIQVLL